MTGPAGTTVTLRTAEVLQDGELYTRPLRAGALHRQLHPRRPAEGEEWEPRFTFHGFRYAEIDGWPGDPMPRPPPATSSPGCYHTDIERTGWFECSDPL